MTGTTVTGASAAQRQKMTALEVVQKMGPEFQRALPKGMDGDRVARLALTEMRKTPKLMDCTGDSFAGALLTASALGLEPGVDGQAYLVPYGQECQLIVGYQGFTKLFWQHPLAAKISAHDVHAADEFDYWYGSDAKIHHKPAPVGVDRGPVVAYYGVIGMTNGGEHFEVLTPQQVKDLRGGKVGPDARFKAGDPMDWMGRKTALKQTLKLAPKNVQLAQAIVSDEQDGSALYLQRVRENTSVLELPAGES